MDQRKPLSYESLKCVMQHMDINFRIIHAPKFPSLRNIQKLIPLRLATLKLEKSSFTVDHLGFLFHLCQERFHSESRPILKLPFDLDKDGFEDKGSALMPGDIAIEEPQGGTLMRCRFGVYNSYVSWEIRSYYNSTSARIVYKSNQSTARTANKMRVGDTVRKQLNKVLGGRRVHQVKHLEIGVSDGILRLPEDLKLKIRELSVKKNGNNVVKAIRPILDERSFPLQRLSIEVESSEDSVFQNEILRSAESLNITNKSLNDNNWQNLLISLPNTKIHLIEKCNSSVIISLARNWIEHPRVIGSRFSVTAGLFESHLIEVIASELNAVAGTILERRCNEFLSCYTLPMTPTSELIIYGYDSPNDQEGHTNLNEYTYMIVLEVMSKGSAKPMNVNY